MRNTSQIMYICSKLLSDEEVTRYLKLASSHGDAIESVLANVPFDVAPLDPEEIEELRDEVIRHRHFQQSILPDDRVWLTADLSRHPEVEHGMPYLVVVRAGKVVIKYRAQNWSNLQSVGPILAPTMRLTREEVIDIATVWVRTHYRVVPSIISVEEFSDQRIDELERRFARKFSLQERHEVLNKWFTTCAIIDMNKFNASININIIVDDGTGCVEAAEGLE